MRPLPDGGDARHTTKPIVYVTMNDVTAHLDATAMAEAVAGGETRSRERPLVACYKNTLFPLVHNREAVRTLLDLAGKGLPCIYSPVSTAGTVAPMTVLGSTVVVNAGVLAGLVMAQLKREGAPYIAIGWAGEALDMRTMVDVFAWPDHRAVYSSPAALVRPADVDARRRDRLQAARPAGGRRGGAHAASPTPSSAAT